MLAGSRRASTASRVARSRNSSGYFFGAGIAGVPPRFRCLHQTRCGTQSLNIARVLGNRSGEGVALGNLGNCHLSQGDYRRAIALHTQALSISRDRGHRHGKGIDLGNLGLCYFRLGYYRRAIALQTQALSIAREIDDRQGESSRLGNLGLCYFSLGDYRRAIALQTQALSIARDIGDRYTEANTQNYLGGAWLATGDLRQAATLLEETTRLADRTGSIEPAAEARSWLARARLQLGDPADALAVATAAREWPYPTEQPTLLLLEGVALLELHRADEAVASFTDAVATADALLALADHNVASLQARALALSGLAAATGDATRAVEAAEAFARADAVSTAAGVVADTNRLLARIVGHDRTGTLTEVRTRLQP